MNRSKKICAVAGLCALVANAGCAVDANSPPTSDETGITETVGEVKSAMVGVGCDSNVYDACFEQADSTGSISIRMYMCKLSDLSNQPAASCPVESDRVLVGGGAQVDGTPSPGALLFGSFPSGNAWFALTKDHIYPNPHRVRAWAIGLRLANYSASQLNSVIKLTAATSQNATGLIGVVAVVPQGHVIVGGGAVSGWNSGPGRLLTASEPTAAGWVAKSKDHIQASVGSVTALLISLPQCPPGLGYCLASNLVSASGTNTSGYFTTSKVDSTSSTIMTSIGGETFYNGTGRMLADLYPVPQSNGTVVSISKDHGFVDSGSTDFARYVALSRL